MQYQTKIERIEIGDCVLQLQMLKDVDQTIDALFELYAAQGKTELFEEMCPYFGTLWAAGKILTLYFDQAIVSGAFERETPKQCRLLEIGCGLALPSLYLAKRGWQVWATDIHPDVPLFLQNNIHLNEVTGLTYLSDDWRTVSGAGGYEHAQGRQKWDLIFASDVLYDKSQPDSLCRFLELTLSENGRAIIADPGRTYLVHFLDLLYARGFDVTREGMFGVIIVVIKRKESGSK